MTRRPERPSLERRRAPSPSRERGRPGGATRRTDTAPPSSDRSRRPAERRTRGSEGRLLTAARAGRRSNVFLGMFVLIVVLNLVGLLMVLSASSVTAYYQYGSPWYQFERQLMWLVVGSIAMLVVMRVDYHRIRPRVGLLMVAAIGMLLLVMVPGIGVSANGSTRWLGYGQFGIQPAEFAKLAILLFLADLLGRRADRIHDLRLSLRPALVVFGVVATLLMLQPNLGTTIIVAAIVVAMLFVAGIPTRPLVVMGGVMTALATAAAFLEPYRLRRLMAFRNPWADPLNTGYQTIQSQVGIANGGLLGTGLGEGRAKWGFLPYAHTDFIFAIIGEELGLVGALTVVALFVALGLFGVRAALRAPDRFGMLIATGVTTWILVQAFINIGAVVGVLPITGVPLPFVSSGGSSLVFTMAAVGVMLNVARQAR